MQREANVTAYTRALENVHRRIQASPAKETSRALSQMTPSEVQSKLLRAEHDTAAQLFAQDGLSLCQDAQTIISHVIHMNFNRLFAQEPRAQEAQFWDVIRRMYENPQFSSTIASLDECIGEC